MPSQNETERAVVAPNFTEEWGAVMRLARRASMLATEDARRRKLITDPEDSAILLYTDDPTSASWLAAGRDTRAICKTSHLEGVAIVMGENFPADSFEAERPDPEMPRVAAMFFPAVGKKCPRCRLYRNATAGPICGDCERWLSADAIETGAYRGHLKEVSSDG